MPGYWAPDPRQLNPEPQVCARCGEKVRAFEGYLWAEPTPGQPLHWTVTHRLPCIPVGAAR